MRVRSDSFHNIVSDCVGSVIKMAFCLTDHIVCGAFFIFCDTCFLPWRHAATDPFVCYHAVENHGNLPFFFHLSSRVDANVVICDLPHRHVLHHGSGGLYRSNCARKICPNTLYHHFI